MITNKKRGEGGSEAIAGRVRMGGRRDTLYIYTQFLSSTVFVKNTEGQKTETRKERTSRRNGHRWSQTHV